MGRGQTAYLRMISAVWPATSTGRWWRSTPRRELAVGEVGGLGQERVVTLIGGVGGNHRDVGQYDGATHEDPSHPPRAHRYCPHKTHHPDRHRDQVAPLALGQVVVTRGSRGGDPHRGLIGFRAQHLSMVPPRRLRAAMPKGTPGVAQPPTIDSPFADQEE